MQQHYTYSCEDEISHMKMSYNQQQGSDNNRTQFLREVSEESEMEEVTGGEDEEEEDDSTTDTADLQPHQTGEYHKQTDKPNGGAVAEASNGDASSPPQQAFLRPGYRHSSEEVS